MLEIPIPKEIKKYKPKYLFKLTFRQNIAVGLMLIINIPLYIYGRNFINTEILSWLMIILAIPIVAVGFFKYNQMNFEEFILVFIQSEFVYPKKRIYKNENIFNVIREELIKQELYKEKKEKEKIEKEKRRQRIKQKIKKKKKKKNDRPTDRVEKEVY